MNLVSTTLSLQVALLAIALAAPGPVQSAETATVSQHDLKAKLVYCKTCHGLAAKEVTNRFWSSVCGSAACPTACDSR